ncbi:hypothetical protein ACR0ST_01790 [Aliidiomarina sp. Khilg15.8]
MNNMQVTSSDFDADVSIKGTVIGNSVTRGLTLDVENYYIRTSIDKESGAASHTVVIQVDYNMDWRYYDTISFKGGETRKVRVIDREVKACTSNMFSGCSFKEIVATSFTTQELQAAAQQEGLIFRLNSRYANIFTVVHFPPNYLRAQLEAAKNRQNRLVALVPKAQG